MFDHVCYKTSVVECLRLLLLAPRWPGSFPGRKFLFFQYFIHHFTSKFGNIFNFRTIPKIHRPYIVKIRYDAVNSAIIILSVWLVMPGTFSLCFYLLESLKKFGFIAVDHNPIWIFLGSGLFVVVTHAICALFFESKVVETRYKSTSISSCKGHCLTLNKN